MRSPAARKWACVAALTALSVISRLPQLQSPNLLLDGDECILGLMAKHVAEGRAFPVFFYGQAYGLSIVEAPLGALSFLIGGIGTVQLKLAMLALWITGIAGYFLTLARLIDTRRGFWIALVLVLMPAWAVSSMKAYSGYLTAFAASAWLCYLLVHYKDRPRSAAWILAGLLTGIIYLAQPVWLPGVVPIILVALFAHRRLPFGLLYLTGTAAAIVVIQFMHVQDSPEAWVPPRIGNRNLLYSFPAFLRQINVSLTGSHYLRSAIEPGSVTAAVAYIWCGILVALALMQVYRLVTRRHLFLSHLLCVAVVSTLLANWILLEARDARYLLPLSALLVAWAGIEFSDLMDRRLLPAILHLALVSSLAGLGALSLLEFRRYSDTRPVAAGGQSEVKQINTVVGYVRMKGANHVFSTHGLLQWQVMFYSREAITARWHVEIDRLPAYVREVDRALQDGEPVALVGHVGFTGGLERMIANPETIFTVGEKYFVYMNPDKDLLRKLRFRFLADRAVRAK